MRYKRILPILSLIVVCAIPLAAFAEFHQGPMMGPGGPMPMPMMMLLRHANLTADQDKQVHQIMETNFTQARPLMKQLRNLHEQMADKLLSPGKLSASDFTTMQTRESNLRNQLDAQMLAMALKIRGLLTPDQLSKVADLHTKLKALHAQAEALLGDDELSPPGPPA
jgi:protein CpxP